MIFFSSTTTTYLRCAFLLFLAFQFIKDASKITEHPLIIVFGHAMELDHAAINEHNITVTSLLASLFASLAIVDLVQLFAGNATYFDNIVPVRLILAFTLTAVAYFKDGPLAKDAVFVWGFVEVWFNFLIYNVLTQERKDKEKKKQEQMEEEILEAEQNGELDKLAAKYAEVNE